MSDCMRAPLRFRIIQVTTSMDLSDTFKRRVGIEEGSDMIVRYSASLKAWANTQNVIQEIEKNLPVKLATLQVISSLLFAC